MALIRASSFSAGPRVGHAPRAHANRTGSRPRVYLLAFPARWAPSRRVRLFVMPV